MIYASKTVDDILLHEELDDLAQNHTPQFHLHMLVEELPDHPEAKVTYGKGRINEHIVREHMFEPDSDTVVLICGPAPMQAGCISSLMHAGYIYHTNVFEF